MKQLASLLLACVLAASATANDLFWGCDSEACWGTTNPYTGVGLVVLADGTRYEFPECRVILDRGHDYTTIRWLDRHESVASRYDCDGDNYISNFDIDCFVEHLFSGTPTVGTFIYTMEDIQPFIDALGS